MIRRMRRFWVVLVALTCLMAVTACSGGGDDASGDEEAGEESATSSGTDDDIEVDEEPEEEEDLSEEEVIEVVQEFWEDEADEIELDYAEVDDDRIRPNDAGELPICEGQPIPADLIENNAYAFGCPEGNAVVWDPDLFDDLTDDYGETGPAVVLAHEFGHVIQFQTIDFAAFDSVFKENQADCYAGAWVAQQVDDEYGPFSDPGAIDRALAAALEIGDPVGSSPDDPSAHGSGFDRVRAFQDGFDQGADYCYGYLEDPPFIEQIPFGSEEDAINEGNLPFDEVTDLVVDDLGDYFGDNVEDFEDPDDPFELYDEDDLEELHAEIGDGTVATILGLTWAEAAQEAVGEDTDGEGPFLQRACLVGTWLGDILQDQQDGAADRPSGASLSPGDLDEAILTFLRISEDAMSEGGMAFEVALTMRQGVFGDIDDCRLDD